MTSLLQTMNFYSYVQQPEGILITLAIGLWLLATLNAFDIAKIHIASFLKSMVWEWSFWWEGYWQWFITTTVVKNSKNGLWTISPLLLNLKHPLHPHKWSISGGWNVWAIQFAPWPSKLPPSPVSCRWCCSFSCSSRSGLDFQYVRCCISWFFQLFFWWPSLSLYFLMAISLSQRKYIGNSRYTMRS